MSTTFRWLRLFPLLAFTLAACGGQSCSCLQPIKGGFPVTERHDNAMQIRVTQGGIDYLQQNGKGLVNALLPGGMSTIDIPPSGCGGDQEVCCGNPQPMCRLDVLVQKVGLQPQPPSALALRVTTQLISKDRLPVSFKVLIGKAKCFVTIDTTKSTTQYKDIDLAANLSFKVDATTRLTSITLENTVIDHLDKSMIDLKSQPGDFLCTLVNFDLIKGFVIDQLKKSLADQIAQQADASFCAKCKTRDDCSQLADSCKSDTCMRGNKCLQEIGAVGRLDVGAMLSSVSPSTRAGLDTMAVLGTYAEVPAAPVSGLSLGMLGGGLGDPHSTCVPMRPAPAAQVVPKWQAASGALTPRDKKPYHLAFGLHDSHLNQLAYGAFDGGVLCLRIGTPQFAQLDSQTLSLAIQSLGDLVPVRSPVFLALRPAEEPRITLGNGTFNKDGSIKEPLLKVALRNLAIDFYAFVDDRYVRVLTLTADVELPLGLEADAKGQIKPILPADLKDAFKNLRVSNNELLAEKPEDLVAIFPVLFGAAGGALGGALSPIALPKVMGLDLKVVSIEPTDSLKFLTLFATLSLAGMESFTAETEAAIERVIVPPLEEFRVERGLRPERAPAVELRLSGRGIDGGDGDLEWSLSFDGGGSWSEWRRERLRRASHPTLWLAGRHQILIRARVAGDPASSDPTPQRLDFVIDPLAPSASATDDPTRPAASGATGAPNQGGWSCALAGRSARPDWTLFAALGGIVVALARRRTRGIGCGVVLLALAIAAPGCGKDAMMMPKLEKGDLVDPIDQVGRHSDAKAREGTIHISAYDDTLGDLAYAEVKVADVGKPGLAIEWQWVDGVPLAAAVDKPGGYRKGITEPGDDVGTYSSLALTSSGGPRIAYYDATNQQLKFASATDRVWKSSPVEKPAAGRAGLYASLSLDAGGVPSIAYLATALPDGKDGFVARLRLATAKSATPQGPGDWSIIDLDESYIPCNAPNLCVKGKEVCVALDPQDRTLKSVCKPIALTCPKMCAKEEACVAGVCVVPLAVASAPDLPEGTGLFAQLRRLKSGLRVVLYHDRLQGDAKYAIETAPGIFTKGLLDGMDPATDVGQFIAAAVAPDDTVHVAYLDAINDRLLYKTLKGSTPAVMAEVIDDGARMDGPHPVGAGVALWTDGAAVRVIYQEQQAADLWTAVRGGSGWQKQALLMGAPGHGFYPRLCSDGGKLYMTEFVYDRARQGAGGGGSLGALHIGVVQ